MDPRVLTQYAANRSHNNRCGGRQVGTYVFFGAFYRGGRSEELDASGHGAGANRRVFFYHCLLGLTLKVDQRVFYPIAV